MNKHTRRRWTAAACVSALALALTACEAANSPDSAPSAPPAKSAASFPAGSPDGPAPSSQTAVPAPAPSAEPAAPTASASPEPSPALAKPTYRMNKAYRIVPIDKTVSSEKVVLLTFDDGPKNADMLGKILDTLDKHNAKAIFFVNGYRVKANPDLLREIDARGQVVGNHSYDHIELGKQSEEKIREQIESVQDMVREITGKTPVFFRPPFASSNDAVKAVAKENGLLFMTWSNGSLDWDLGKETNDKPQAVIDNVMEQLHAGSNILMHELEWTAEALDPLLTQLEEKGYSFVDPNAIEIKVE